MRQTSLRKWIRITLAVCGMSGVARGQESPLSSIFKEFNGVAVWSSFGKCTNTPAMGYRPMVNGVELAWRYGLEILLGPYPETTPGPVAAILRSQRDSLRARRVVAGDPDGRIRESLGRIDAAIDSMEKAADATSQWEIEVGIGLDFSDSYRPAVESLQVRLPLNANYASVYVYPPCLEGHLCGVPLTGYIGFRGGLYTLSGATGTMASGTQYELSGSSFSWDVLVGVYKPFDKNAFFLELSYKYLAFDGVRYKLYSGASPLSRASVVDRIDLSGVHLSLGFQFARK